MHACACGQPIKNYRARVCVTCRNRANNAKRRVTYDADYIRQWSVPDPITGCWLWSGSRDTAGYGKVARTSGESMAHRLAYRVFTGLDIQHEIDHTCYEPSCVNVLHLRDVTASENSSRRRSVIEARNRLTCKHGHIWDDWNTIWRGTTRICRTCGNLTRNKIRSARRAEQKAAHAVTN